MYLNIMYMYKKIVKTDLVSRFYSGYKCLPLKSAFLICFSPIQATHVDEHVDRKQLVYNFFRLGQLMHTQLLTRKKKINKFKHRLQGPSV